MRQSRVVAIIGRLAVAIACLFAGFFVMFFVLTALAIPQGCGLEIAYYQASLSGLAAFPFYVIPMCVAGAAGYIFRAKALLACVVLVAASYGAISYQQFVPHADNSKSSKCQF